MSCFYNHFLMDETFKPIQSSNEWRDAYYGSSDRFKQLVEAKLASLDAGQRELLRSWAEMARDDEFISWAGDPPVSELSIKICKDVDQLIGNLVSTGTHKLGEAYAFGDLCFINQIEDDDFWLVYRGADELEPLITNPYPVGCKASLRRARLRVRELVTTLHSHQSGETALANHPTVE